MRTGKKSGKLASSGKQNKTNESASVKILLSLKFIFLRVRQVTLEATQCSLRLCPPPTPPPASPCPPPPPPPTAPPATSTPWRRSWPGGGARRTRRSTRWVARLIHFMPSKRFPLNACPISSKDLFLYGAAVCTYPQGVLANIIFRSFLQLLSVYQRHLCAFPESLFISSFYFSTVQDQVAGLRRDHLGAAGERRVVQGE